MTEKALVGWTDLCQLLAALAGPTDSTHRRHVGRCRVTPDPVVIRLCACLQDQVLAVRGPPAYGGMHMGWRHRLQVSWFIQL